MTSIVSYLMMNIQAFVNVSYTDLYNWSNKIYINDILYIVYW